MDTGIPTAGDHRLDTGIPTPRDRRLNTDITTVLRAVDRRYLRSQVAFLLPKTTEPGIAGWIPTSYLPCSELMTAGWIQHAYGASSREPRFLCPDTYSPADRTFELVHFILRTKSSTPSKAGLMLVVRLFGPKSLPATDKMDPRPVPSS